MLLQTPFFQTLTVFAFFGSGVFHCSSLACSSYLASFDRGRFLAITTTRPDEHFIITILLLLGIALRGMMFHGAS